MGFFSNAVAKIEEAAKQEIETLLIEGEQVESFYVVKEDYCCLTNKRVIFVDKSMTSSKKSTTGIPYGNISAVGLNKGGAFSISKEVVLLIGSRQVEIDLYDTAQATEIFKTISTKIC